MSSLVRTSTEARHRIVAELQPARRRNPAVGFDVGRTMVDPLDRAGPTVLLALYPVMASIAVVIAALMLKGGAGV